MTRFSIVDVCGNARDIPYLLKELRQKNLVSGTEKDIGGDTIYLTSSINAVKKLMEDYDGLVLDIHKG